jgi:hypothetical protein
MASFLILVLLDLSPAPGHSLPWVTLLVLLAVVFLLAVAFTSGLVFFLIRLKRRKRDLEVRD